MLQPRHADLLEASVLEAVCVLADQRGIVCSTMPIGFLVTVIARGGADGITTNAILGSEIRNAVGGVETDNVGANGAGSCTAGDDGCRSDGRGSDG